MRNIPLGITPEHTTALLALGPSIGGWLAGTRADDGAHRAPAWTNTGASVVRGHECYQIRIGRVLGYGVYGAPGIPELCTSTSSQRPPVLTHVWLFRCINVLIRPFLSIYT